MQALKMPIGIQSFEKIRTGGYVYIDKTPFIARMASQGGAFFLSRPRRFGKSLLLDTMDLAFSGRRELFAGLYLDSTESRWDWSRAHPVVRISFATGSYRTVAELNRSIMFQIEEMHQKLGIPAPEETLPSLALRKLITVVAATSATTVVVLVDEYDKPILDALPDVELSAIMRAELRRCSVVSINSMT